MPKPLLYSEQLFEELASTPIRELVPRIDRDPVPILLADDTGRCRVGNIAAQTFLQIADRQLVGLSLLRLIPNAERQLANARWEAFRRQGFWDAPQQLELGNRSRPLVHVCARTDVGPGIAVICVFPAGWGYRLRPPSRDELVDGTELSQRERQVLGLAADGMPLDPIAEELGLTAGTVRNYLRHARIKLGAADIEHAAALAHRRRLI